MIKTLNFKFGAKQDDPPLSLDVKPITIFVGPNNSGKSQVLIEIEQYCRTLSENVNNKLLISPEFIPYTEEEILQEIEELSQEPLDGETLNSEDVIIAKLNPQNDRPVRLTVHKRLLIEEAQDINRKFKNPTHALSYINTFIGIYTARLDGASRLTLLNPVNSDDLQKGPTNKLSYLFRNDSLKAKIRKIIYKAFSKYLVIDPTNMGQLRVCFSDKEPENELEEKSFGNTALDFYKKALPIENTGDGIKAFSGIISSILAGEPKIALIDEPEAFLHPL